MTRWLALIGSLVGAGLAGGSASLSETARPISFRLEAQRSTAPNIGASFDYGRRGKNESRWSTSFMPSELVGLDLPSFHASGTRPIRFTVARDAGRLDCNGTGGGNSGSGTCRFSRDPLFAQLLMNSGIARPTSDQWLDLIAVNARRGMIEALTAAHYHTPDVSDLTALAAVGVDGRYVGEMSRIGYRPASIEKLIEVKAVGITPQWLAGFVPIGYANVAADGLVQMRALAITPDYIRGFQHIGYRNLPVSTLVQLKALNITPQFIRSVSTAGEPIPPVEKLVELRMFSKRH